jgi:hypothetical protein
MVRSRSGAVLVAALAAAAATVFAGIISAAPPDAKFTLAVLRRDGLMIPFASFNGRAWDAPWPAPGGNEALPISLGDVPKEWWGQAGPAAAWTAWLLDRPARPLKIGRPVHAPVFCGAHLAVSTDYRSETPIEPGPTVPKDGLAVAGDVRIEPVVRISLGAQDAASMIGTITDKFNEEESLAAANFTRWTHPFGGAARAALPISLEAFYRATAKTARGEVRTSYIEAVRRFPELRGEGCGLLTFAHGWVTEVPGKKPVINIGARVTYCDRAEVSFMLPLGRILVPSGSGKVPDEFWVYQLSSWRDELYGVARISPEGVKPVVAVAGGGCPRDAAH